MKTYFIILIAVFFMFSPTFVFAQENKLWEINSIDTMKSSRDEAENPGSFSSIPIQVAKVAESGANYIAISTPYDERFAKVMKIWVTEARKKNLNIWFRGNFAGWEGWFNTPLLSSPEKHHQLTQSFIFKHPELFAENDIFTPVPEPENGIIGDPRNTGKATEFNQFLIDSYDNCVTAFRKINKKVKCGYFSVNGDIAKQILTPEMIAKTGGTIVIDHYTKTTDQLISDILFLHEKLKAKVLLGEFGAPIPDIHGPFTEREQSYFIDQAFQKLFAINDIVLGINYWTLSKGSTGLLNSDNTNRLAFSTVQKYFDPQLIRGTITLDTDIRTANIIVSTVDKKHKTKTDKCGRFALALPEDTAATLVFERNDLLNKEIDLQEFPGRDINIFMESKYTSVWKKIKSLLENSKYKLFTNDLIFPKTN